MNDFDVVIVGGGIAGAGVAAELAGGKRILILEAEEFAGYHSTGRSVAFWTESYGGQLVQPLTTASGPMLSDPPPDLGGNSFLSSRGALHIGTIADTAHRADLVAEFAGTSVAMQPVGPDQIAAAVPGIRLDWTVGVSEPECSDIDVAALHAAYLAKAKRSGTRLETRRRLIAGQWREGRWALDTTQGPVNAAIVVNAAGAWADSVAQSCGVNPLGIQPYRRTVVQLSVNPAPPETLPLVIALDGSFYFKPEPGGRIWLSPHDETPCDAADIAAEEYDVALAIDRLQRVVDWDITRLERRWAGLRSFAPDRIPVLGPDPQNAAFVWAAGQGGFGIQTAPAASRVVAASIDGSALPPAISAELYLPNRLR